jgi:signal transduction histidine kinase
MKEPLRDLTEKRTASDALLKARECLGCTHEGVIVTTAAGVIVENNIAAEQILETPSINLQGTGFARFCALASALDDLLDTTRSNERTMNRSFILVVPDGKQKIVNMSAQRLSQNEHSDIMYVFQNCADLRTMEERLVQSERLATIGKFASQVAHEIRNPLSSISLNLELLEDELKASSDEAASLIRSVMREVDRLNDIVGEYLQFSRFPKPQLKRGRIENVVKELAASLKLSGAVRLEIDLSISLPEIWLDENLLKQVLENLVRNGAEAIEGSGTVRIEVDMQDRFVAVRVSDTGHGIPAEVRERLFEPFFTTKPRGTGLGLATSQQIIFEHNGHLLVESQAGKGSTFTVLLPL